MRAIADHLHVAAAYVTSEVSRLVARGLLTKKATAHALGFEAVISEIRREEDIAPAFDALEDGADALYVRADPLMLSNLVQINTLALGVRLPTMHGSREYVQAGV